MGEVNTFIQSIPLDYFIILSSVLFCLGVMGVLLRKNAIVILGCVELMLNSVNLLLAAFSAYKGNGDGQLLVFFIMVVAAAEVAVGLAIIAMLYRNTRSVEYPVTNSDSHSGKSNGCLLVSAKAATKKTRKATGW